MNDHTRKVLEFDSVLSRLATHAQTPLGVEACLAIEPESKREHVDRLIKLLKLADEKSNSGLPSLSGISDLRSIATRSAKGGVARGEEIAEVSRGLRVMISARSELVPLPNGFEELEKVASQLPDLPGLLHELERCVDSGGEVLSEASPELALARHKKAKAGQRILETIQRYTTGKTRDLLSDPVYTTRSGRYVIPLKAENKGKIRGIIHDSSASGQTVYLEPEEVVQLGNQLREAEAAERAEVERVLQMLSSKIGRDAVSLLSGQDAATTLDLLFAKVRYGHSVRGCVAELVPGNRLSIKRMRHPLIEPEVVVPLTISLGESIRVLLITGPNTGGKTVAIKAVGLAAMMIQSGMMVPAEEAKAGVFPQVWADIGDEQSLTQSLSTFSGHIKNIAGALRRCADGSLVLLDEVGAGTDPAEGAALAGAILKEFKSKGAVTMASSHYGELKVLASNEPGFMNASMEFDVKSLRPTYKLLVGTPGSSHALKIAARYGLPDPVIEAASQGLTIDEHNIAKMIERLEQSQRQAVKAQSEADRLTARLRQVEEEADRKLHEADQVKTRVRDRAATELEEVLRMIRLEAADVFEQIKKNPTQANLDKARKRLQDLQSVGNQFVAEMRPSKQAATTKPTKVDQKIEKGMTVMIHGFDQKAVVLEAPKGRNALVQVGALKMHVPTHRITTIDAAPVATKSSGTTMMLNKVQAMGSELHMRHMRAEDAKESLDKYLDDAIVAGLDKVRLVHGKGEGILRKVVHNALRAHRGVKSFRDAEADEGGHGVTIAFLH